MVVGPDQRRRDLARIHLGAKALGLDRETYEALLWSLTRTKSAGNLNHEQRQQVIAHLNARGAFHEKPRRANPEWGWIDSAAEDRRPMLRKIVAMLRAAGRVKAYADGIAAAMFRIERLELCGARELRAIITALMKDGKRHPVSTQRFTAPGRRDQ